MPFGLGRESPDPISRKTASTEEWLHTETGKTQCPHSDQHHTTDIGNDDDNNNRSSLSSIYCVPGTETGSL